MGLMAEMDFVKVLGKGSYGSVNLYSYKQNDGSKIYSAVKTINSEDYDILEKEFRVLSELRGCPSIVQLYGSSPVQGFDSYGNIVYRISMEYAAAGTLTNFIERNRTKLSDSTIKDFTRLILRGLVSIHGHSYIHCDLKPDNLLLFPVYNKETWDLTYELKISDFGSSIKAGDKTHYWSVDQPWVGTPLYMSPESVLNGKTVEKTLDLWSLGCIVLEMYTGKPPWLGLDLDDLESILLDHKAPEIPESVPCDARQFLEKCFARKPEERGTASELLLHPFLIEKEIDSSSAAAGKRNVLRFRKPNPISEHIPTKPQKKLKIITRAAPKFKKVSKKSPKRKIDTLRSDFVPVQ